MRKFVRWPTLKYEWPLIRKAFFIGLLLTGAGIFFVMYNGWNEATMLCLVVGPFLLFCCLMLALSSGWMARVGTSHLPEGWDHLSYSQLMLPLTSQENNSNSWSGTPVKVQEFGVLRCEWDGSAHWYRY